MNVPAKLAPTGGLARLRRSLLDIADEADALAEQGDKHTLAFGLADLREVKQAIRDLEQHVEDHVVRLMDKKVENLDDEVTLEKKTGWRRKNWQSIELLRHLVGDQIVDPETGEAVFDTIVACVGFTGSTPWRVGELKKRDIDPDEWCQQEEARTTVRVQVRRELPPPPKESTE